MKTLNRILCSAILGSAALLLITGAVADDVRDDAEELKIAAVEALISAPADRALPLVTKILAGNHSDEIKERALFVLSQIDRPAAQSMLLDFATSSSGAIQHEAIRMIGIGGNDDTLLRLQSIYDEGDSKTREAVLEAFLIADRKDAVYDIALSASGKDYENAVETLSAMGAREELRQLSSRNGISEALIEAYAVSGDLQALRELARDSDDPEMQAHAIEAMGMVGGDEVNATLVGIFRDASSDSVREAALDGMLVSGYDAGVLELYRSTDDAKSKRILLEYLVIMGSDEVWNIIDSTLSGDE